MRDGGSPPGELKQRSSPACFDAGRIDFFHLWVSELQRAEGEARVVWLPKGVGAFGMASTQECRTECLFRAGAESVHSTLEVREIVSAGRGRGKIGGGTSVGRCLSKHYGVRSGDGSSFSFQPQSGVLAGKKGWIHPNGMGDGHKIRAIHSTLDVEYLLRLGEIDLPDTLLLTPHTMPDGEGY